MEYQNIANLLDTTLDNVPRFISKNWIKFHDQSCSAEDRDKPRFKTSMLRSDLCDFSDAYIVVKGRVTATFNPKRVINNVSAMIQQGVNNDFPGAPFFFLLFIIKQVQMKKKLQIGMLLHQMLLILQTVLAIEKTLLKVFLLETMFHSSTAFQKLMGH